MAFIANSKNCVAQYLFVQSFAFEEVDFEELEKF